MSKPQDWMTILQYAKYAAKKHRTEIFLVKVSNDKKCWKMCRRNELLNDKDELVDINVQKVVRADKTVHNYADYKEEVRENTNQDLIEVVKEVESE